MKKILLVLSLWTINILGMEKQINLWHEKFLDLNENEQLDFDSTLETKIEIWRAIITKDYKRLKMLESSSDFQCNGGCLSKHTTELINEIEKNISNSSPQIKANVYIILREAIKSKIREISYIREHKFGKTYNKNNKQQFELTKNGKQEILSEKINFSKNIL